MEILDWLATVVSAPFDRATTVHLVLAGGLLVVAAGRDLWGTVR